MKKIIFIFFLILGFSRLASSITMMDDFKIEPNSLFVQEERGVLFTAQVGSRSSKKPQALFLLEMDSSGEKIRYHWELKDEGVGDLKAHDGIYSRKIQFKEKQPKTLHFLVVSELKQEDLKKYPMNENKLSFALRATLEIKPRPSFIEILSQVWEKIKNFSSPQKSRSKPNSR